MSILDRYQAYATAFERSYEDGDWSQLEPYFKEDAVFEDEPEDAEGREAILEKLKASVNAFDRKMDSRNLAFEPSTIEGNTVRTRWSARYTKSGCPDLVITGVEFATFDGDRIARLHDEFDPEAQKAMGEWLAAHGARL